MRGKGVREAQWGCVTGVCEAQVCVWHRCVSSAVRGTGQVAQVCEAQVAEGQVGAQGEGRWGWSA